MEFSHLERLGRADCRRLLPTALVGRLAVLTPDFPTLEPVSFAVVEGELVVAVRPGGAGDTLAADDVVSFEADVIDHDARQGWSVTVTGAVEELDADVAPLVTPLLRPWPVTAADRPLLIRSDQVSGQRLVSAQGAAPAGSPAEIVLPAEAPPTPGSGRRVVTRRALGAAESLSLLAHGGQRVGRLVITLDGEPVVFPLNYAVDGDAIVFRTKVGTKLTAITRSMVTFEVDDIDPSGGGWAVTLEGLGQEVLDSDPEDLRTRLADLTLDTWPGGDRLHMVRIMPYRVEGTAYTTAVTSAATPGASSPGRPA